MTVTTDSPKQSAKASSPLPPAWEIALLKEDNAKLSEMLTYLYAQNAALFQKNELLQELIETDTLTGLKNLHHWNAHSQRIWDQYDKITPANQNNRRSKGDLVLVFIDVNGLGSINKDYGDHVGDALIKCASQSLTDCFKRASDMKQSAHEPNHLIVRKGGDELIMLLPQTSVEFLDKVMNKINHETTFSEKDVTFKLQCSYGFSVKSHGISLEQAKVEADANMQAFKKTAPKSRPIDVSAPKVA